ncbi:hypothetical protein F3J12_10260 [Burkholderia sp. Ax-1735]|nr:hypothetical protein [Burkholderia sp. Ap-955]NIF09923.1 hypothetical protein [Burkholderia sp. Ax-1735]NIG03191.1 hypothetical protein [Burkholderia sp. Tr-849]
MKGLVTCSDRSGVSAGCARRWVRVRAVIGAVVTRTGCRFRTSGARRLLSIVERRCDEGGESRRYWVGEGTEEAVYRRGAMHIECAERLAEAKCFMDVT